MAMPEVLHSGSLTTRRWNWQARRAVVGFIYTIPTLVFIGALFVTPLLLVIRMSATSWPLLRGPGGITFPKNYISIVHNRLFWPAVTFTIEYTILATILLIGLGLGLAVLVQPQNRWISTLRTVFLLPVSLGLAAASLLAYGFFSREIGPIGPLAPGPRPGRKQLLVSEHPAERSAVDDVPDRLEVCRLLHAHPARRAAGHSRRCL